MLRAVRGVPLIYIKRSVMILEPMADESVMVRAREERSKFRAELKSALGKRSREDDGGVGKETGATRDDEDDEDLPKKKKKKNAPGPKGPNPLAVKKPKKKPQTQEAKPKTQAEQPTEQESEEPAKKKRRRKGKGKSAGASEATQNETGETVAAAEEES